MRLHNRIQTHGIIQSRLDVSRSVRSCPVIIRHLHHNRFGTVFEVGTYRCHKDTELIFLCRLHPDHGAGGKHIRTDIKRRMMSVRRHPVRICPNHLIHCTQEPLLRERGHLQTNGTVMHASGIQIRSEGDNSAVLRLIGLESFKAGL